MAYDFLTIGRGISGDFFGPELSTPGRGVLLEHQGRLEFQTIGRPETLFARIRSGRIVPQVNTDRVWARLRGFWVHNSPGVGFFDRGLKISGVRFRADTGL